MQNNLSPKDEVLAIRRQTARIHEIGNELRRIVNEKPRCECGNVADWDGEECRECYQDRRGIRQSAAGMIARGFDRAHAESEGR